MIWRYYGEVFVLITASFLVGCLVAAVVVRLLVREQAPPHPVKTQPAKTEADAAAVGGDG